MRGPAMPSYIRRRSHLATANIDLECLCHMEIGFFSIFRFSFASDFTSQSTRTSFFYILSHWIMYTEYINT